MNTIKNAIKNVLNFFKKEDKEMADDFVILDFEEKGEKEEEKKKVPRYELREESDESLYDEKLLRTKKYKQKQRKRRNAKSD